MTEIVDIYIDGVRRIHGNYFAQWLPTTLLNLGDVGILEKRSIFGKRNFFKYITTLEKLDIQFEVKDDPSPAQFKLTSDSGVERHVKFKGEVSTRFVQVPEADIAVGYDFAEKGGFAVEIPECYEPSIKDIHKLGLDILNAYEREDELYKWQKNWFVITRVVQASSSCILISQKKNSKIDFSTKADIQVSSVSLGDAEAGFQWAGEKGSVYEIRGAEKVTPYFQLAGMRKKPFLDPEFGPRMKDGGLSTDPVYYEGFTFEQTPDEYPGEAFYLDVVTYDD